MVEAFLLLGLDWSFSWAGLVAATVTIVVVLLAGVCAGLMKGSTEVGLAPGGTTLVGLALLFVASKVCQYQAQARVWGPLRLLAKNTLLVTIVGDQASITRGDKLGLMFLW